LKLKDDKLLSNFGFNCKLRHYGTVGKTAEEVARDVKAFAREVFAEQANRDKAVVKA